jgi:hypothetical protein
MGLDVYVGPLSRYYSGNWETIVQQMGRQSGMSITVIRPKPAGSGRLRRFLRFISGGARTPDPASLVAAWAGSLSSYAPGATTFFWPDSPTGEYFTDKPAWDCYGALVLWAAYDELQPAHRLASAKDGWDRDPAYLAVVANIDSRYRHLIANTEIWLPVDFDAPFEAPMPTGNRAVVGSCQRLLSELEALNARTWRASLAEINAWREAGAEHGAPLETSAKFGFAVFCTLASKAVEARLPMKLDY